METKSKMRVRFAPSPTGNLHIGSVRTALFNWLLAKANNGTFVLRIEDTDKVRSKPEFEENILKGMRWLGLDWDEGPGCENDERMFYHQSKRSKTGIYKKNCKKLLIDEQVYCCFCTPEELVAEREKQKEAKEDLVYSGKCRDLPIETVSNWIEAGKPYSMRFKMPKKQVIVKDLIRGDVTFDTSLFGDMVIMKADRTPAYNFAVVIDDIDMAISHVIRGEDHLSNTPKQLMLFEALGQVVPQYGHLSMILGPDRKKLSKRHGATSVSAYADDGYLPETIVNFLALLGWSHPEEKELLSLADLISVYDIERVVKSNSIFDVTKLAWMNGQKIRAKSDDEFVAMVEWPANDFSDEKKLQIAASIKQKMSLLTDFSRLTTVFFNDAEYDINVLTKNTEKSPGVFDAFFELVTNSGSFMADDCSLILDKICEDLSLGKGKVFKPVRYFLTGSIPGPDIDVIMAVFGRELVLKRLATVKSMMAVS
jgi:nondiscriminating glutamyl-tRNA synthetase